MQLQLYEAKIDLLKANRAQKQSNHLLQRQYELNFTKSDFSKPEKEFLVYEDHKEYAYHRNQSYFQIIRNYVPVQQRNIYLQSLNVMRPQNLQANTTISLTSKAVSLGTSIVLNIFGINGILNQKKKN